MSEEENKPEGRKPRVSKFAMVSLVFVGMFAACAVLWLGPGKEGRNKFYDYVFMVGVISLAVSFVSGVLALLEIGLSKRQVKGAGIAVAGVLISGSLLLIGYLLPKISSSPPYLARRIVCMTNLNGLGKAIMVYSSNNDGEFPTAEKWCDLLITYAGVLPKQFICPKSNTKNGESSYAFNVNLIGKTIDTAPPDTVLLFETKSGWNQYGGLELLTLENHEDYGCNVLFNGGYVEFTIAENINNLNWGVSKMAELKTGDKAVGFELLDQDGKKVKLSDFAGKKVLLYFYPKADTPGCTTQACSVRDSAEPLKDLGVVALGISPDEPAAQKKFDEKYGLGFRLLSDPNHKTAEAYGVWGEKSMLGKKYMGITRSSFLIDEQGKIIEAWYKVSPADTIPNALNALGMMSNEAGH